MILPMTHTTLPHVYDTSMEITNKNSSNMNLVGCVGSYFTPEHFNALFDDKAHLWVLK